jgi:3-dehydroquinate synthase class II
VFWVKPERKEAYLRAVELAFPILVDEASTEWKDWMGRALSPLLLLRTDRSPGQVQDRASGHVCASYYRVQNADDLHQLESSLPEHATVIVETIDWKLIPVENLVSLAYRRHTRLLAVVPSADAAAAQLASLERGVHGVVLTADRASAVERLAMLRERYTQEATVLTLKKAIVQAVRAAGVGDRVCLDTCSLLAPHEGVLIGSSASMLALVLSEAAENAYVASRPFRVNAGAVHSYILQPDGTTRYLSELRAGDELLVVDARSGRTRTVILGRAKIERRPLLLIQCRSEDSMDAQQSATMIVQNAETVRLATPEVTDATEQAVPTASGGTPVTVLTDGHDRIIIYCPNQEDGEAVARHLGRPVKEFIREY